MMRTGHLIIFETDDGLRIPSAIVHRTLRDAEAARERADQRGRAIDIIEIQWDDSTASKAWR